MNLLDLPTEIIYKISSYSLISKIALRLTSHKSLSDIHIDYKDIEIAETDVPQWLKSYLRGYSSIHFRIMELSLSPRNLVHVTTCSDIIFITISKVVDIITVPYIDSILKLRTQEYAKDNRYHNYKTTRKCKC